MKEIGTQFLEQEETALVKQPTMTDDACNACVLERVGLAQAMVPSQPYTAPQGEENSLVCGTVFADLVMPYPQGFHIWLNREGAQA